MYSLIIILHAVFRKCCISRWLVGMCLVIACSPVAEAHHGCDGNVRVRLLPDQTLAILQMDPMVLDILLKDQAPAGWSPQEFESIRPRLEQLALTLFEIQDSSRKMEGRLDRVTMDVSGKIAFILKYPALLPSSTRLTFRALYSAEMGPAFQGTLSVLGAPTSPMEREGAALGSMSLTPQSHTLSLGPDVLSKKP
jgi:hypothetical protein